MQLYIIFDIPTLRALTWEFGENSVLNLGL